MLKNNILLEKLVNLLRVCCM